MSQQVKASAFPTIAQLAAALQELDRRPPLGPEEMFKEYLDGWMQLDVRLQVRQLEDGEVTWRLWTGDSSYDNDHRGFWGSTSLAFLGDPDDAGFEPDKLAEDLREQALDSAAMFDHLDDDTATVASSGASA